MVRVRVKKKKNLTVFGLKMDEPGGGIRVLGRLR